VPNFLDPRGTSTSSTAPKSASISSPSTANTAAAAAGRISVSLADPSKTIQSSLGNVNAGFIGVGKGLVSIVENLPIVGGIAKPIIGLVGGIADATIGQGVSALEKIKIGDSNLAQAAVKGLEIVGAPLGFGLDVISAPSRFVEQKVAEARIISTQTGKQDLITTLFGAAPSQAIGMMQSGATLEQAAQQLADSNAGFSEDDTANLLWSLLLDPVNFIAPGIGKFVDIGADVARFSRMAEQGVLKAASQEARAAVKLGVGSKQELEAAARLANAQKFMKDWGLAGAVYNATFGKASLITKRFSTTIAKEAITGWTRTVDTKVVGDFFDSVKTRLGQQMLDRGLKNVAITFHNAIKSGSVRAVTSISRSNSADLVDRVISHFAVGLREGKTVDELMGAAAYRKGDVRTMLNEFVTRTERRGNKVVTVPDTDKINTIIAAIEKRRSLIAPDPKNAKVLRMDEFMKDKEILALRDELTGLHADFTVKSRADALRMTAEFRANVDPRLAQEEAVRIFREAKNDRIAAAANPERGKRELVQDLMAGFGADEASAVAIAEEVFTKHAGDIKALQDILSTVRSAAYGQAAIELAGVRALFIGSKLGPVVDGLDFSRITITSNRSLTNKRVAAVMKQVNTLKKQLAESIKADDAGNIASIKQELKDLADEMVNTTDELGAQFAGDTYSYDQVFNFIKRAESITVRDLTDNEINLIRNAAKKDGRVQAVEQIAKDLEAMGYRLGLAPESKVIENAPSVSVSDHFGREALVKMTMPFVDPIDEITIQGIDAIGLSNKLRPSGLTRIWDKLSRPYGAEIVKNNIAERFVTSMVQKTGISVNRARQILAEVNSLAASKNLKPQALFMDSTKVEEIFRNGMGDSYGKLAAAGTDPIKMIIDAAAGDWSVAGLTSGFTGRVKALAPEITVLTDIAYPQFRFGKLNPFFNLVLERIETNIMNFTHGVRRESADALSGEIRGTTLYKAYKDPRNVVREINDGLINTLQPAAARATGEAAERSLTFRDRVNLFAKNWLSQQGVKDTKTASRNMMADRFAVREFMDNFERVAPGKIGELAIHYGVTSGEDVVRLLLEEYLIQSDPIELARRIAQDGAKVRGLASNAVVEGFTDQIMATKKISRAAAQVEARKAADELAAAVVGAYEATIELASRQADKAQYFASQRSWFERSMNHPFLGFYPYSYMTQKAIPSLLRIMFLTPGRNGLVMPGFGYAKYEQFIEWSQNRVNTNEDVVSQLLKNDALLYVFTTLLPVTPDSMGFSAPTWIRRSVVQPGLRGTPLTPGAFAPGLSEIGAQVVRGTVLGQGRTMLEGLQSVQDKTNINNNLSDFIQTSAQDIQEKILQLKGQ
jgi:hypothetical protein